MQKYTLFGIHILLLIAFAGIFILSSCKHTPEERNNDTMKLDAPLRTKITQMERDNDQSALSFYIELTEDIDDEKREVLKDTGIEIKSAVDKIIVAEGDPDSIKRTAQLEFVRSLSLSMTRRPFN